MNVLKKVEEAIRNVLPHSLRTCFDLSEPLAEIAKIIGDVFIPVSAPLTWLCMDIIRTEHTYELQWSSVATSAECPHCKQISTDKSHTYFPRKIQDLLFRIDPYSIMFEYNGLTASILTVNTIPFSNNMKMW
jgi:hypothetical protein